MTRVLFLSAGCLMMAFAIAGIILPLVPGTPFLIAAAFCFSRGSPRARHWLLNHAHLGPPIRDWEERGAISRSGKWASCLAMGASIALALWMGLALPLVLGQALCLALVGAYILSRPS
ncbi:YbaN family protein [Pseudoroseicyclus aestuarii]|uniref:Inner membrane protein n=1 Tax=Pseudoroseicyclus aestuarii TaxID=1795041 RepID=A0A318SYZ9_9RHOB|nr:YbaN family protein [Pseudoroseicyclus aestuarii]PYE85626.1 hypothetical protein DFP88_101294 [Pseudoroseicyclus aestuarii]